MLSKIVLLVTIISAISGLTTPAQSGLPEDPIVQGFRPPAVPLIVMDPFITIWSMADNLYDNFPQLWCGVTKAIVGAIRIDGTPYRYMGPSGGGIPIDAVITQTSVRVEPTQTYYTFENDEIILQVTFSTAAIPTDLDLLSTPITYITYDVSSKDGKEHQIEIYYDHTAEITVSDPSEEVTWWRPQATAGGPKFIMGMGTTGQAILGKSGDCDGINWGYSYLAVNPVSSSDNVNTAIAGSALSRSTFINNGSLPTDDIRKPRAANDDWPVMAVTWSFQVSATQNQSRYLTYAYDDIESISYFGKNLQPYWRRNSQNANNMLANATRDYNTRINTMNQFDANLLTELFNAGGANYSTVTSLAFRQTMGGCKLVWNPQTNTPWYFMKEISSDGDIQTVDVIFPASPLFFYLNPYLIELMMIPLLEYANNETYIAYNLTWAPHHLGTYPIANIPPMSQEQMPVEETGNLLMMIAALATYGKAQGKDFTSLIFPKYQNITDSWALYLTSGAGVLPDPGDQLCTDDFLGPSPHNTNLALKGIASLGCYAQLCKVQNRTADAAKWNSYAANFTNYWIQNANDGNHYRLQYNLPNTWSLKYNLLYQYVVGVQTFPQSVITSEIAFYVGSHMNEYGVPLNSEVTFTKVDWLSWMAAMAPNASDRQAIFNTIFAFANTTSNRVPLTDWYDTTNANQKGFQARTVVGGIYAWMLLKPQTEVIEVVQI